MSLEPQHRARLIAVGVDGVVADALGLRPLSAGLPDWWSARDNALYLADGVEPPSDHLLQRMVGLQFSNALIVLASPTTHLTSLLVSDDATVYIGPESQLMAGEVFCGAGSLVLLHGKANGTRGAILDARNGGSIVAGSDQLWAADVYIATDDMHRVVDVATGARLNPYGAHILIGEHVWLGREAAVTGHVEIGSGSVVGARALVRGQKVPDESMVVGVPARVVREGVTWDPDDLP